MVHLLPLPGAPDWDGSMERVLAAAVQDATALAEGGVDGIMVENYGDAPFLPGPVPAHTIAALTNAVLEVRRAVRLPVGVNVLRNDAAAAIGICAATGASFVRINVHTGAMLTDQGWIEGAAHETRGTEDKPMRSLSAAAAPARPRAQLTCRPCALWCRKRPCSSAAG